MVTTRHLGSQSRHGRASSVRVGGPVMTDDDRYDPFDQFFVKECPECGGYRIATTQIEEDGEFEICEDCGGQWFVTEE